MDFNFWVTGNQALLMFKHRFKMPYLSAHTEVFIPVLFLQYTDSIACKMYAFCKSMDTVLTDAVINKKYDLSTKLHFLALHSRSVL